MICIEERIKSLIQSGIEAGSITGVTSAYLLTEPNGMTEWDGTAKVYILRKTSRWAADVDITDELESELAIVSLAANKTDAFELDNEVWTDLEPRINSDAEILACYFDDEFDAAPLFFNGSFHDQYQVIRRLIVCHK